MHMYSEYGHAAYDEAKDFNRIIYDFYCINILHKLLSMCYNSK